MSSKRQINETAGEATKQEEKGVGDAREGERGMRAMDIAGEGGCG